MVNTSELWMKHPHLIHEFSKNEELPEHIFQENIFVKDRRNMINELCGDPGETGEFWR